MNIETPKMQSFKREAIQYLDSLWTMATWMTQNNSDAENLTEKAFVEAYRKRGNVSAVTENKILLFQTLISIASQENHWSDLFTEFESIDGYDLPVRSIDSPQSKVISANLMIEATRKLPMGLRIIMILSSIEKFSYSEIAQIVGCTTEAVSKMKYLCYKFLHNELLSYLAPTAENSHID